MIRKRIKRRIAESVEKDVSSLLDMLEFYLTERQLKKPIGVLGDAVRDMRLIVGRIIVDYFLKLSLEDEDKFCSDLADMLVDRSSTVPVENEGDRTYHDYCTGEILTAFEYAMEIKKTYPEDHVLQKMLALDIPILRPFDYGLQDKFQVIPAGKFKKFHGV